MDAQDITNLLTLGLGGATVWLGWETRRMAIATRESVELQSRPYLAFAALDYSIGKARNLATARDDDAVRIGLKLSNPGQVLIQYEVEELLVQFEGRTVDHPQFDSRRGYIHPKTEAIFRFPWIFLASAPRPGQGGEVTFKVNYWATLHRIGHATARLRYSIQGPDLSRIEWHFLEGPTYV
jgi:hypothetical protein